MTRILVLDGHPDPAPHLVHALAEACAAGAQAAGHEVRRIVLAELDVPLLRSEADFHAATAPGAMAGVQADVAWCEHLVLVFPLWLGGAPALVEAALEQTMRPGFAYRYRDRGFPELLLKGRSARIVATMGMPALAYRFWFWEHGVKRLTRSVLGFVGFAPIRRAYFGGVGTASEATRARWLAKMREWGEKGA